MDALVLGWLLTRGTLTNADGWRVEMEDRTVLVTSPHNERTWHLYLSDARSFLRRMGVDTEQGWK